MLETFLFDLVALVMCIHVVWGIAVALFSR